MRTLFVNELEAQPGKLLPILHYLGSPITAKSIVDKIKEKVNKYCDQQQFTAPLQKENL